MNQLTILLVLLLVSCPKFCHCLQNATQPCTAKAEACELASTERVDSAALVPRAMSSPTRDTSGGLGRLCLDNGPDGIALLTDTESDQEVIIFFKTKSYWPTSLEKLQTFLESDTATSKSIVLSELNEYDLMQWDEFPPSPNYVVSPSGLDKNHTFYNNLFSIRSSTLFRHRVTKLQLLQSDNSIVFEIKVEFLGRYSIAHWPSFHSAYVARSVYMPRGTRILAARLPYPTYSMTSAFLLVDSNLDSPVEIPMYETESKYMKNMDYQRVKYYYELNDQDDIFYLNQKGVFCYNDICKPIRSAVNCPTAIIGFTSGLLFWTWSYTDLTLRLLAVGLSSIMVIDFILSLGFIYNQINRVLDLT